MSKIRVDGNLIFKYSKEHNMIIVESEGDMCCHNISGHEIVKLNDFMAGICEEWDSINKPTCPNCAQFLDECLCIDEQEAKSFDLAAKAVAGIEDSLEQEAKPEHKPCPNCGGSNIESDTFDEGFFIECVTCDFRTGDYPSEVSAWACWDKEWK